MTNLAYAIIAGACFIVSLSAGIWLFLHLNSVAARFEGTADMVSSDANPRKSRAQIVSAVTVLITGAVACVVLAVIAMG